MKNYVVCSDKYSHLIPVYSKLIDKYWNGSEIVFLGYKMPKLNLPDNHSIESIDKNISKYSWCSGLIKYFSLSTEKYFGIFLEDMLPIDFINLIDIENAISEMNNGADKVVLYRWNNECKYYKNGMVIVNSACVHRATLHPSIWKREYFLNCLYGNNTPWKFELQKTVLNDGSKIFAFKPYKNVNDIYRNVTFPSNNVYIKGKLSQKEINQMYKEDINLLTEVLNCT